MIRIKTLGLAVAAIFALSAAAASSALAQPEFSQTKVAFKSVSGKGVLKNTNGTITCQTDKGEGEITGVSSVSATGVTFEECSGTVSGKKCPSSIATNTLTGELGTVAKEEATSEVGLLFKPKSGTTFAEFECEGLKVKVQGSIASEVEFVEKASEKSNIIFTPSGTGNKIKKITTTKEEKPKLELSVGGSASLESTETITPATKGFAIFICLPRSPGDFETLVQCAKSENAGTFSNGWNQYYIW